MQDIKEVKFFTEYGDANRYKILEVIGKGSYGVVCAAIDTHTGGKVAIKKIHDVFEHISDAIRILREVKLLRLLRHPDIVEIKRIMLPPSKREFKDIYVVFELMESDLHQVIKANDDLTREHQQFFLYQMLRALKFMHTGLHSFILAFICILVAHVSCFNKTRCLIANILFSVLLQQMYITETLNPRIYLQMQTANSKSVILDWQELHSMIPQQQPFGR